ncbi:hypothetical protein C8F01DRAFT_1131099 [Mycena amicta]|nr:hypothetical protein C8F01DRAFT_1131099 [Mycena amicta]
MVQLFLQLGVGWIACVGRYLALKCPRFRSSAVLETRKPTEGRRWSYILTAPSWPESAEWQIVHGNGRGLFGAGLMRVQESIASFWAFESSSIL